MKVNPRIGTELTYGSSKTMKLIVNADDLGFSESVNRGIIDAYKNGIVTSTTIMMNMPAVEHAFKLYKEN